MIFAAIAAAVLAVIALLASLATRNATRSPGYGRDAQPYKAPSRTAAAAALALGLIAVVLFALSCFFVQDVTKAAVVKSWTGQVKGDPVTEPGMQTKGPFDKVVSFDIRNQLIAFVGDGEDDYQGGKPYGARITTTDKNGAQVNIDAALSYSLQADRVDDVHAAYQDQERFEQQKVAGEVRSVVRDVPGQFTTDQMRGERSKVAAAIQTAVEDRLGEYGVTVDSVLLQEVDYSDEVDAKYQDLANAQTDQQKANTEAETARIRAEGEAEANRITTDSLTPAVVELKRIDMLRELAKAGNLMIVPEGEGVIVQTPERPTGGE